MRGIRTALGMLTTIPALDKGEIRSEDFTRATVFFPVVGALIGWLLWTAVVLLTGVFDPEVVSALSVLLLVILTGGLHLDGLADLADGLAAGGDPAHRRAVMRDSRLGAFGALAVTLLLLLQYALILALLRRELYTAFVGMAVWSRWAMVLAAARGVYPDPAGLGRSIVGQLGRREVVWSSLIALLLAGWLLEGVGLLAGLVVLPFLWLFQRAVSRRLGGLTGDALGALNELAGVWVLFWILLIDAWT